MIEFKGNDKFINKHRLSTFRVTYPRTVTFYTGFYDDMATRHNLMLKIKDRISEESSNMTYVRGGMTKFTEFLHDRDFSKFFTQVMDEIKPIFLPNIDLNKELTCTDAWGNCIKKGDIVDEHIHSQWHGILYLTEGVPLNFPEMNMTFTPKPGEWIISPPQIRHGTDRVESDKERICLVFNFQYHDNFRSINEEHNNTERWKNRKTDL